MTVENISFDDKRIAEGYANRPWLHKTVIERIAADCGFQGKYRNGLDVGCGAGLSTKALKLICERVTGTDVAESMIQVCRKLYPEPEYRFYVSSAENTMRTEVPYDIVTAAGVVNWVDKEAFIKKMDEVMAPEGLLLIYDFELSDQMKDKPAFTCWYWESFLADFPRPPREERVWQQEDLCDNFLIKKQINYRMEYEFSLDDFVEFLLIQSNVNAQVDKRRKNIEDIRNQFQKELSPIFDHRKQILIFNGYSWYIQYR